MKTLPTELKTPWGKIQTVEEHTDGVWFISTAGHGGYYVSPERNEEIPLEVRRSTWCGQGLNGFYEEDEDAEIVRNFFKIPR